MSLLTEQLRGDPKSPEWSEAWSKRQSVEDFLLPIFLQNQLNRLQRGGGKGQLFWSTGDQASLKKDD